MNTNPEELSHSKREWSAESEAWFEEHLAKAPRWSEAHWNEALSRFGLVLDTTSTDDAVHDVMEVNP